MSGIELAGMMNVVNQLFQLQEIDQLFDTNEQAISQINAQLGQNKEVLAAGQKLASEQQQLETSKKQQRTLDGEIGDLSIKITDTETNLYGGSITNPKELANLQQEISLLKNKRSQLEDDDLQIMSQVEKLISDIVASESNLRSLESAWLTQQKQLGISLKELQMEQLKLDAKRQSLTTKITPFLLEEYRQLRKHKGSALGKVEQGVCQGCRIALSVTELREIRGDKLTHCGSCGRILFQN